MQNNSSFKLFKHEAMLIHSVSLLYFRSHINPLNAQLNPICHLLALLEAHHILYVSRRGDNAVRSMHIPSLAQYHRHTVTSLLAGLWRNRCWKFRKGKHFFFTPKHADQFWDPTGILLSRILCIFPG